VLLRWRHRARLVVTRHFAARRGSSPAGRLARPVIARGVDVQIAISRFVADSIDGPSTVIHNGVHPSTDPDAPRSNAVVVMQRFEREKQTTTALQAWSASGLAARGWRLELYGRGAEGDALLSLTRRLGMAGSVDFRGFVDDPRARLARASIMLATAPAEPFGLSVVEAMAEGTPVVAADGGAHRETLGADGEFFAPGDAAACAELLVRLADSPERRGDLGARLRERQRAGFTITANVDRLEKVYAS
jgi:glycosyltransferase involved in cell wall biosynthesis